MVTMLANLRVSFITILGLALAACAAENAQLAPTQTQMVTTVEPQAEPAATATVVETASAQEELPAAENSDLVGRLYTIGYIGQQQHLLTLDLASGEETSLMTVAKDAWLSEVVASPDGQRLLLAYAPTPEHSQAQYGFTALYVMPADASAEPELLVAQEDPSESFYNISWPLDDTIYFVHFAPTVDELNVVLYVSQIERAQLPGAEVEVLVKDAAWPRLSNDGARLAYVTEAGELMISAADGSSPEMLLGPEAFAAVDAPVFSPDGDQLYFSTVDLPPETSLSPLDRLLGVQVAYAHSVPSDWWLLAMDAGSQPERLTTIDKIGLYGDFDDDGRNLYFVAADGVYVMDPNGQNVTQLATMPTVPSLDWTP
jgi:WD40-like Beta Propeller Repeat